MPIETPPAIVCQAPRAIDGDTIACANLSTNVRLLGIDAPELPGHCRRGRVCAPGDPFASKAHLGQLLATGVVEVRPRGHDRYGRILARVTAAGVDASCKMISSGTAIARYGPLDCTSGEGVSGRD